MKVLNLFEIADIVSSLLRKQIEGTPSDSDIVKMIGKYNLMFESSIGDDDIKKVKDIIEEKMNVRVDNATYLKNSKTFKPWLHDVKSSINFNYWDRYRKYLLEDKGRPDDIVSKLDTVGNEILDLIGNPLDQFSWKRKGLVLGDIQSGKTQTYNALITKAADVGYKLIIVLTGIQEALRKQTQERIDSDFIGLNSSFIFDRDKKDDKYIGVGKINKNIHAFPVTTIDSDFNIHKLKAHIHSAISVESPIVFVIKKNATVLKYLYQWLNSSYMGPNTEKIDKPLLLIDDEADNASINTKNEDFAPTTINCKIREILHLFARSSYVAVTATPFANIFIDPEGKFNEKDDLFPSDFIYSLSSPSNYIGCDAIFGDNATYSQYLEIIDDAEDAFKSSKGSRHKVDAMPMSLCKAINYFLLCNMARDILSIKSDHRTMLINVSQFTYVQETTFEIITNYLTKIQNDIKSYSKFPLEKALQLETFVLLKSIWNESKLNKETNKEFAEVYNMLSDCIMPIKTTMINTSKKVKSLERLYYDNYKEKGLRVIVVGGNSLSRGLTLEGLCVSYFYRESKTYDTLLQMGRWFGYRTGYDNLVRIWLTERTKEWFEYINDACEELRTEINTMNKLNLSPIDFGLKVLDHPGPLSVTAGNKMRTAEAVEIWLSLSGMMRETAWLPINTIDRNYDITINFLNKISKKSQPLENKPPYLFTDISCDIITQYILEFASEQVYNCFDTVGIIEYINNNIELLTKWDVRVVPTGSDVNEIKIEGMNIKRVSRIMELNDDKTIIKVSGNRSRVGNPGEVKMVLDKTDQDNALQDYLKEAQQRGKNISSKNPTVSDSIYLRYTKKPVLFIYFMMCKKKQDDKDALKHLDGKTVVGISIGFPRIDENEKKVKYQINLVEQRKRMPFIYDDDFEGDEEYDN